MMMNVICPGGEDKKEWKQIGSVSASSKMLEESAT